MGTSIDVVDLLRRVEALENAIGIQPQPKADNRCAKCGIDWYGATGYVCGMTECPMQHLVTC